MTEITASNPGTLVVTATIVDGLAVGRDYTEDFTIEIKKFELIPGDPDPEYYGTWEERYNGFITTYIISENKIVFHWSREGLTYTVEGLTWAPITNADENSGYRTGSVITGELIADTYGVNNYVLGKRAEVGDQVQIILFIRTSDKGAIAQGVPYYSRYQSALNWGIHPRQTVVSTDIDITPVPIGGVGIPVTGETPSVTVAATEQFTGRVMWYKKENNVRFEGAVFEEGREYFARVELTAKEGYTFARLLNDQLRQFTVDGGVIGGISNRYDVEVRDWGKVLAINVAFPRTTVPGNDVGFGGENEVRW